MVLFYLLRTLQLNLNGAFTRRTLKRIHSMLFEVGSYSLVSNSQADTILSEGFIFD